MVVFFVCLFVFSVKCRMSKLVQNREKKDCVYKSLQIGSFLEVYFQSTFKSRLCKVSSGSPGVSVFLSPLSFIVHLLLSFQEFLNLLTCTIPSVHSATFLPSVILHTLVDTLLGTILAVLLPAAFRKYSHGQN